MSVKSKLVVVILVSIFSVVKEVRAQMSHIQMPSNHIMVIPDSVKWGGVPAGLPPGAQAAVIEGDPRASGLFTIRLNIPAG